MNSLLLVALSAFTTVGIAALAFATQGHMRRPLTVVERLVCGAAGVACTFPDLIDDYVGGLVAARLIGMALLAGVIAYQFMQKPAKA